MKNLWLLVAVILMAVGCGGPDPKSPPEIKWHQDICDFCHMGIEDQRFAGGYRLSTGEQRIFDDIGDLIYYLGKEQGQVASVWLRDYERDQWLQAETAWLVEAAAIESPMGYGLAAAATEERARALAAKAGGTALTWQQLRTRGVKPPRGQ